MIFATQNKSRIIQDMIMDLAFKNSYNIFNEAKNKSYILYSKQMRLEERYWLRC